MTTPALIAVDWGTTSCRATLLDGGGAVVESLDHGRGILSIEGARFEEALVALVAPWFRGARLPIVMSGMIGSRQGWQEAAYVRCPAGLGEIAARVGWIETAGLGRIALIPGLDTRNGDMPDVMRGEETQIIGAFGTGGGLAVLPGTHCKWATVEAGRITSFRSYMTGEVFAALRDHTILGRLMQPSTQFDQRAFERGVLEGAAKGGPGALLNRIFATRTLGLFDELPGRALADYLSGLLIGAEVAEATAGGAHDVVIIGNVSLTQRYVAACQRLGHAVTSASSTSAAQGAYLIARAAGLLGA